MKDFYFTHLKKVALRSIIAGVILFITFMPAMIIKKYNDTLSHSTRKIGIIKRNLVKMINDLKDRESILNSLDSLLPDNFLEMNGREMILLNIDELKSNFENVKISIIAFEERDDKVTLPVEMTFPLNRYGELIELLAYLKTMTFPFFKLNTMSLYTYNDDDTGGMDIFRCMIVGNMVFPSVLSD